MTSATSLDLGTLSAALASGELSSAEATAQCLDAIKTHDGALGSFLLVDEQGALDQAKAADARRAAGDVIGPLDGVPIGLKDNFLTEGMATTAASRILEGYVPPYDGTSVAKLKAAGAVILGKLNCDEFAMGSSNENSAFKPCRNPWSTAHSPGGSSGGSAAAVAAGLCAGALGTDTGGSIRQPAAFCGVAGLKPSYGRVSRFGVVAFASSLDQVGPFARDVAGCAHLLKAIAGVCERDATSVDVEVPDYASALTGDVKGLKIGIARELFDEEGCSDEVRAATEVAKDALAARGAEIVDVHLPNLHHSVATYYIVATAEASSNLARYDGVRFGPRRGEEQGLEGLYAETRGQLFGDEVKRRILLGTYVLSAGYYDAYYLRAQRVRALIAEDFNKAYEAADVLLTPVAPTPAFRLGEKTDDPLAMYLSDVFTIPANLAGLCGLSVNAAFNDAGLPVGVQLTGRPMDEATLLRAGHALEQELGLLHRRPSLA
jgi:aspartyl-tRNA(Asn)/glutamyl-tRNA(Gln) amidotransferase subunit A